MSAACDADGSRYSVVELAVVCRRDATEPVADAPGHPAVCFAGIRHPQTQGKVERFHGSLERALVCRGVPSEDHQQWLDAFRREHNHIRPHQALDMQTPASRWLPSPRRYNPNLPAWQYPEDAWTLKVDSHGAIDIHNQSYPIAKSLIGERVRILPADQRYLVYYCNTLIRELDPTTKRSTIVERFVEKQNFPTNL
jgi:Integrase core domain